MTTLWVVLKEIYATEPIFARIWSIPLHLVVSTGGLMEPRLLDVALFVVYTTIL